MDIETVSHTLKDPETSTPLLAPHLWDSDAAQSLEATERLIVMHHADVAVTAASFFKALQHIAQGPDKRRQGVGTVNPHPHQGQLRNLLHHLDRCDGDSRHLYKLTGSPIGHPMKGVESDRAHQIERWAT